MRRFNNFTVLLVALAFVFLPAYQAFADLHDDIADVETHNEEWGFPHKQGIVLVLSGGGTKGLSHIGVFEILEREHIPIAAIVGTSMGAVMGGLYASGYTAAEMRDIISQVNLMEIISERSNNAIPDVGHNRPPSSGSAIFNVQMDEKKRPRGKLGVLQAKDLYTFLSELTTQAAVTDFNDLPIPFAAIATDLENGDTVVLRDGNLASALRASLSIPGVFEPWEMDGRLLVDGGLKANLPVIEAKKMFPGHPIVAVNLSPKNIRKPKEKLRNVLEVAAQTLEILMVNQVNANAAEADLIIAPRVREFGILDSGGYEKIIERGVLAAEIKAAELHALVDKHAGDYPATAHFVAPQGKTPTVAQIRFEGVPKSMEKKLYDRYDEWVGWPLDMKMVADTVKHLSDRDDILSVEARTTNISKDAVAVVFSIHRPPKYEFGFSGYASNIHPDRWASLSASMRDILFDGDAGSLEYRFGTRWGGMLRYFTPLTEHETQFGLVLSAREEGSEPVNSAAYDFERYTGKIAWYKSLTPQIRIGAGYAAERARIMEDETLSGPYLSLLINTLDDPIMPTKGIALTSDLWFPIGETTVTHTTFQTHLRLPFGEKWKLVFSGGLKTGDGDDPAYAAALGTNEELYSLAHHPLIGDQAYWLHLGTAKMVMKSWWGGLNVELFGNYGQVLRDWNRSTDWWETGIALTLPTNNFGGRLIVVYDQEGEFTIGYSIGIPQWWNGPLP